MTSLCAVLLFFCRDRMEATLHKVTTLAASRVTFYSVRNCANFRQRSDSVVYLSPTFLSVLSGPGVASFFIISFFDMFPVVFPL